MAAPFAAKLVGAAASLVASIKATADAALPAAGFTAAAIDAAGGDPSARALAIALAGVVSPLGPTAATITTTAAGTAIASVTGLLNGEAVTSVSPANGTLAISGGAALVVGLVAPADGLTNYTITTSMKRTFSFALTSTPALQSLDAFAASQPVTAAYGLRRLRAGYAGNCIQVRDSSNTLRTLGFNADGTLNTTGMSGFGDGVTFTMATWYDQTPGTAHNFTSTVRPRLVFPNAPTNYLDAYIDFTDKNQNMVTATGAEFLNLGGTANLSALIVAGVYGWTSAGTHPRNPAVPNTVSGTLLGYGTTAAQRLVTSATGDAAEVTLYGVEGELLVDASTPDNNRRRVFWWNQAGANVSGGDGTRKFFSGRPHGVSATGPHRLVLGNHGGVSQSHNGPIREVYIYNNASPLSDTECQRIAYGLAQAHSSWIGASRFPDRYVSIFAGQSNAQYYAVDNVSGDGVTVGSNALTRVFEPAMKSALSIPANAARELKTYCNTTAVGGSPILKRIDGVNNKYWWDADTSGPGPSLTQFATQIAASDPGKKYRKVVLMWSQGEAEANTWQSTGDAAIPAEWKAQTKLVWQYIRNLIGYDCPIVIQPLGKQTGAQTQMDALRVIQSELAAEVAGVTISTETNDLQLQDSVHFSSSLKGPNQSANGYDLAATRLAASISNVMLGMAAR